MKVNKTRVEEYVERVRQRVDAGREEDLLREKERIQKKHKDTRIAAKGPKVENDSGAGLATAGDDEDEEVGYDDDGIDQDDSGDDRDYSDDEKSTQDYDGDSDEDNSGNDIRKEEDMALKMLEMKRRSMRRVI